ncbi:NAD-dependent epimerase/dehydratase family protein [Actinomadura madurae]|uniref:NAD-dependent epimerase/dehydratase family protein n=1 Tax=Actinomadura madurae TaxID=1993 RepID=UPI0020261E57|nr:NAD-dependent epimerase/dehydratase family protein [Actinomadura madurae]MCP9947659.1 NAD-dependent epimerase/dehydratase family protein [Actinomadura madurae]MCP9964426.1 NAD-dependent epimerase/dehydratase family protein [Actinomadura madurae]MCP9976909.1 NAD-dependent epimerase/dehydratase family protein [Actinomadura madurae]MCQ0011596.1 NAD-dependent epimerase/dehydratase family protein [Actinomadura madurae]MCQ0013092.1 NAD-dependent epimerase/dehydratase family protein [Actinomadura 
MNVLLTGSAGFIGSHIAEALTAAGHRVRGLDLRPDGLGGGPADVRDPAEVARRLEGVDAVCHQAAKVGLGVDVSDLPDYTSVNVQGTAVLLAEMARAGVGVLVLASSMVIYGEGAYSCDVHGPVRPRPRPEDALRAGRFEPGCPACGRPLATGAVGEEAPPGPRNVYADTKLAQEHLAASWARSTGGSVAALRYHNVYGPRMPRDTPYAGVAAIFRSRLMRGEEPLVFEDGAQRRDFVHVRDVARANVLALERVAAGPPEPAGLRAYNIASGEPRTIGDMADALAAVFGGPRPRVTGGYRLGDVRHIVARPDRARRELGFSPSVPFADGVAEFARRPVTSS